MEVKLATEKELENWWDGKIKKSPENNAYKVWKENFIIGNRRGSRKTFFVFEKGKYIGQGTLLLESDDAIMTGGGKAEIIKLEIIPEWRGKGVATEIYKVIEQYARQIGIDTLTIGVEPSEVQNMQIYFHWGFTNYLQITTETYPPEVKNGVGETITVLCYSKKNLLKFDKNHPFFNIK